MKPGEPGTRNSATAMADSSSPQQKKEKSPEMLDIREIQKILPYRYPFLLLDRILEVHGTESIVAIKNLTINEGFFQGHFPGRPIMPGMLIVEAMAQATAFMVLHGRQDGPVPLYLVGVDKVKFLKPVIPGDQLRLEIHTILLRDTMGKVKGQAFVDGSEVARAEITFAQAD